MVALGEVGDEGHGHAHVDAGPDGDGEHGQEEGPPGAGAGLVKVPLGHGFVRLQREEGEEKGGQDEQGEPRGDSPRGSCAGKAGGCRSPLLPPALQGSQSLRERKRSPRDTQAGSCQLSTSHRSPRSQAPGREGGDVTAQRPPSAR